MPDYRKALELIITLSPKDTLGALRLWNYNKSTLESVKGFKEIEVEYQGKPIFSGMVKRGSGNVFSDFSSTIEVVDGIKLPNLTEFSSSMKIG